MKARYGGLSFDFLVDWHTLFEVHLQTVFGHARKPPDCIYELECLYQQ
jgi:hypothetical protein